MNKSYKNRQHLLDELQELTSRVTEQEVTLRAILNGEVDGLVVSTDEGDRVFTLSGADHPYRVMVENMNEGALTLAPDGTILFCNQRFADIVKGPLVKIIGSSIYQYISSTDHELFKAFIAQGLNENAKTEMTLETGDDNPAPVLLSIKALEHTDMPGMACMVITDLSDQKRNEAIVAEGRLTSQILLQTSEIFLLCDPQGRIIRASRSSEKLIGRSPIFQAFDEVFHLLYPDGTPFVLLSEMSDKSLQAVEVTSRHGDNDSYTFVLSASPLINHQDLMGIIVVLVNITERKQAEIALQKAHEGLEEKVDERTVELRTALSEISKLKDQL
ncbi:MAG: PAS domain-containing protein, partial [Deltaproteobacteria bacterium]|nr:PAS domain-containing protein [Deltaproteobacteria bacterium]